MNSYENLIVWKRAMDLATELYRATEEFPQTETYGLTSLLRRAAAFVPSNIAEGHAQESTKEYLRYLPIAQGSRAEPETKLFLAGRLGFLKSLQLKSPRSLVSEVREMAYALRSSLKNHSVP